MSDLPTLTLRGPLHARLAPRARGWHEINGYQVPINLHGAAPDAEPWLLDETWLPRLGFKGRGAAEWLTAAGVILPEEPNSWRHGLVGLRVIRLGAQDFLLETYGGENGDAALARLAARWSADSGRRGQLVPRQHALASILVGGARSTELFARLCAVDLRPGRFAANAVAQTQVALTSAIVHRDPRFKPAYRVYVDTSLAVYLWDRLHEVALALGGGARGFGQVYARAVAP